MQPHSPILKERPFNRADGDRYLILVTTDKGWQVAVRTYNNRPVLHTDITEGQTFRDMKGVETCMAKGDIASYEYRICKVNEVLEPRYFVQYFLPKKGEPYIYYGSAWYLKEAPMDDTYLDHAEASAVLDRYKKYLLEYYYSRIMNLKRVVLP